jgi:hypothetical protein
MKRSGRIPRTTPLARRTRVKAVNATRKEANHARSYGGVERIAFVAALPCVVMGCRRGPCENAHATTGGTGRKADAETVFPCCPTHHRELHNGGAQTFQRLHSLDLAACAAETERRWQHRADLEPVASILPRVLRAITPETPVAARVR